MSRGVACELMASRAVGKDRRYIDNAARRWARDANRINE